MARKQLVYAGRNVNAYYRPDRRSIARCAVGPEVTEAVNDIVDNIAKPFAIEISPQRTGRYRSSFERDNTYVARGHPDLMTRVVARLVNTDAGAAAIEFGRKGGKGHHVLGRTLSMLIATGVVRAPDKTG